MSSKRIAFIVNGLDKNKKLKAGKNDVNRICKILENKDIGSCDIVNKLINASDRSTFLTELKISLDQLNNIDSQFIFYFSGHAENNLLNKKYYLKLGTDEIDFQVIIDDITRANIKKYIIILDTCYSGAALNTKNAGNNNSKITFPKGSVILTSSDKHEESSELEDHSYSIFTDILCSCIENGLDKKNSDYIYSEDIIEYINKEFLSNDKYKKYREEQPQKAYLTVANANESIWIAKNNINKVGIKKGTENNNSLLENVFISIAILFSVLLIIGKCSKDENKTTLSIHENNNQNALNWKLDNWDKDLNITSYEILKKVNNKAYYNYKTIKDKYTTYLLDINNSNNYNCISYKIDTLVSNNSKVYTSNKVQIGKKCIMNKLFHKFKAISNLPNIIKLTWSYPEDQNITSYKIFKMKNYSQWKLAANIPNKLILEYIDKNISSNTLYRYKLYAVNNLGEYSIESHTEVAHSFTESFAVENIKASKNLFDSIHLSWEENKNIKYYKIYMNENKNNFSDDDLIKTTNKSSAIIKIDDRKVKYFKIVSVNNVYIESKLKNAVITIGNVYQLKAPKIDLIKKVDNGIFIKWSNENTIDKINQPSYKIYREQLSSAQDSKIFSIENNITTFIDKQVKNNVIYSYRISAIYNKKWETPLSESYEIQSSK